MKQRASFIADWLPLPAGSDLDTRTLVHTHVNSLNPNKSAIFLPKQAAGNSQHKARNANPVQFSDRVQVINNQNTLLLNLSMLRNSLQKKSVFSKPRAEASEFIKLNTQENRPKLLSHARARRLLKTEEFGASSSLRLNNSKQEFQSWLRSEVVKEQKTAQTKDEEDSSEGEFVEPPPDSLLDSTSLLFGHGYMQDMEMSSPRKTVKSLPQVKSIPQVPSGSRHQTVAWPKLSSSRLSLEKKSKSPTAIKKRVDSFVLKSTRNSSVRKLHTSQFAAKFSNHSCEQDRDDSKESKKINQTPNSISNFKEIPELATLFSEMKIKNKSKYAAFGPAKSRVHSISMVAVERVPIRLKGLSPYFSHGKPSASRDQHFRLIRE